MEGTGGHALDGRLTLAQRAESLAIQRMLDEHLYWVMLYGRWVDPEHKRKSDGYLKEVLGVPSFLLPPVAYLVRRRIRGALHGHGLGRHSRDTIYQFGITDVAALSHWLGSRPYGFGDTPTVVDACMAAYIGNIIRQWGNPLTAATAKYGNLIAHFERVMAQAFPELSAKAAA